MPGHFASDFIIQNIFPYWGVSSPRQLAGSRPFTHLEASQLCLALERDSGNYYHSALASFADALNGLRDGFYTWATVKLYYSAFYSLRAHLALRYVAIFYFHGKPFVAHAKVGEHISRPPGSRKAGTTHGVVLELFKREEASHFVFTQEIAGENPLDWLQARRNEANYSHARFIEPDLPGHFGPLASRTIRKLLNSYLDDRSAIYIFDPDHAMIAFPLYLLSETFSQLTEESRGTFSNEECTWMRGILKDATGPFHFMRSLLPD